MTVRAGSAIFSGLLEAYLPTIYASGTLSRDSDGVSPLHSYPKDKAQQWLAFLARHLH
jgi:hypothetical protein